MSEAQRCYNSPLRKHYNGDGWRRSARVSREMENTETVKHAILVVLRQRFRRQSCLRGVDLIEVVDLTRNAIHTWCEL